MLHPHPSTNLTFCALIWIGLGVKVYDGDSDDEAFPLSH